MAKLSIVMPVYNSEKFLHKSVDAILKQTFTDWELILVNDGSKDNSLAICQEYAGKDERIRVIDKKNEGAGPTRNAGIAVATGEYIVFPDSDDWLDEDAYQKTLERIEKSGVDLLIFGIRTHVYDNEKGIVERTIEDQAEPILLLGQELCREKWAYLNTKLDMGGPWNKIYRMGIIKENNLQFPNLRRMQDIVFNMHYYDKIHSIEVINENFYNRIWHSFDFQRKKMPPTLLDCAITYHKTAMEQLANWGNATQENIQVFHDAFMVILHTVAFEYLPQEACSFKSVYRHIKKVNNNSYVHSFLREYKKLKKHIRKKEIAMLHKWNLLLAINSYKNLKRNQK